MYLNGDAHIIFLCNSFGGFNFIPDWEVFLSFDIFVLNILLETYSMNILLLKPLTNYEAYCRVYF